MERIRSADRMHGDPPMIPVAAGIVIGLIASFVQSAGLTLQRKSHLENERLPEAEKKADWRRPLWLIGFAVFLTSNLLGSVFQIASLPVVILAPLGAISLLWNALFAYLLLGDVFTPYMLLGTILIAGGAVLIAIFGIVPEGTHSLEDLLRLFGRKEFVIYFSLLGATLGIVLIITHIAEARLPVELTYSSSTSSRSVSPPPPEARNSLVLHPTSPPVASERTPLLISTDNKSQPSLRHDIRLERTKLWLAISYASASGILSGMCLLFAKSGVELLVLTITGKNQFASWESWALLCGLVAFALAQLWYLHKSLHLADPTLVCPLAFCFYNLSSIFNGLVYYDQFALLSVLHLLLVFLGIAILLGGVWAVSIQPGGTRRVEVGTWQEGAEVLTSEVMGEESAVVSSPIVRLDEPPSPGTVRSRRRRPGVATDGGTFLSSSTDEEEGISPLRSDLSDTPFPSLRSPARSHPHGHRHGRHGELGPGTPGLKKRWSLFDPHNEGVAPGLSIGLSATSPGFALVPRKRVSSSTSNFEESPDRRVSRGRSVSEGDPRRSSNTPFERRDVESGGAGGGGGGEAGENGTDGQVGKKKGWWRRVFNL